jgi:hypothetical protein
VRKSEVVGAESTQGRAGLAGDSLFQPRDLDRLMKPLLCMHVGPEAFCCDDVMLCSPAEAQQQYRSDELGEVRQGEVR